MYNFIVNISVLNIDNFYVFKTLECNTSLGVYIII